MSNGSNFYVMVIGHQSENLGLPEGFHYLKRKSDLVLSPDLPGEHIFLAPSVVWSEYSAWFENTQSLPEAGSFGLFHYRCALSLFSDGFDLLPKSLRNRFLLMQKNRSEQFRNFLRVGNPNFVSGSAWEQFMESHSDSLFILKEACLQLDLLLMLPMGTSENRLKTIDYYFPRNIFLTDTGFGREWLNASFEVAKKIDPLIKNLPLDRWGGYILERLFTVFVLNYIDNNQVHFSTGTQVYFVETSDWIKFGLLKFRLVRALNNTRKKYF